MNISPKKPFAARALTPREMEVGAWLISHGTASDADKAKYLDQLSKATVIGKCECGCASIDLGIEGCPVPTGPLCILGDFVQGDCQRGVFVFARENILAGIEIYPLADMETCGEFPPTNELRGY